MRTSRVYLAGVVLGATLVGAAWLYSYRTWHTIEVFDARGQVVASHAQPWWSVYATVALILVGAGASLWLLPEGSRHIKRFVNRAATRFSANPL